MSADGTTVASAAVLGNAAPSSGTPRRHQKICDGQNSRVHSHSTKDIGTETENVSSERPFKFQNFRIVA